MDMDKNDKNKGGRLIPLNRTTNFARLKALRCFAQVHQKLLDGWSVSELARWIQKDQHEYTDITKAGLVSILQKYRTTIPAAELASKNLSATQTRAIIETEKALDELEALRKLYELQMDRVNIDLKNEKNIHKLLPTMTQEIRVAKELLESYSKLKESKGLTEKHLGTLSIKSTVEHIDNTNPDVQKVLDDPQSRKKVLAIAQRLLGSVSEETVQSSAEQVIEAELLGPEDTNDEEGSE